MSIIDYMEISFIKGIGNRLIKKLIDKYGSVEVVLKNPEVLKEDFGDKLYDLVKNREKNLRKKAEEEVKKAEKLGFKIVCLEDNDYPDALKEIPDPPAYIYLSGSFPKDIQLVSVVGSRKHTVYGKSITKNLVRSLVENGIGVVSGLASGIDRIAHETALENNGFTIAVLGGGIDQVFPYENKDIYRSIRDKGLLLSEFSMGHKPSKFTFPIRNRIIAGLSLATIVIEASEKSGSLITARYANEYGRIVFSVPSNITNPHGKGTNNLIKEGAVPITDIQDIYETVPYLKKNNVSPEHKLSSIESVILELSSSPVHIDMLSEKSGIKVDDLMLILFDMEIKGIISIDNGMVLRNI